MEFNENLKGRDHFEDLGIDHRKILKQFLKNSVGRCDQIQDKDWWWVLVNTTKNLQIPEKVGTFLTSCSYQTNQRQYSPYNYDKRVV